MQLCVNQTKNKKKGRENEEEEEGKSTIMEEKKYIST